MTCAIGKNINLALQNVLKPNLTINDPTGVSLSFDPHKTIDVTVGEQVNNTTLSYLSDIYSLKYATLIAPTFRTYNLTNSNDLQGEIVYYFEGTSMETKGYYCIVPVYKNGSFDIKDKKIASLFPQSEKRQYIQYPYCKDGINYFVLYFYNGIEAMLGLQTKTTLNNVQIDAVSAGNWDPRFSSHNIIDSNDKPINTSNELKLLEIDPKKDLQGNYLIVHQSPGITKDQILKEATAAQKLALNTSGMNTVEWVVVSIILFFTAIIAFLCIYYLWRWINGDLYIIKALASVVPSATP